MLYLLSLPLCFQPRWEGGLCPHLEAVSSLLPSSERVHLWTSRLVQGPDCETVNSQEHLIRDEVVCLDVATTMNKETGASLSENSSPEAKAQQPWNPSYLVLSSTGKVLGLTSGVHTYPQWKLNDARFSSEKSWLPTLAVLFPQS